MEGIRSREGIRIIGGTGSIEVIKVFTFFK